MFSPMNRNPESLAARVVPHRVAAVLAVLAMGLAAAAQQDSAPAPAQQATPGATVPAAPDAQPPQQPAATEPAAQPAQTSATQAPAPAAQPAQTPAETPQTAPTAATSTGASTADSSGSTTPSSSTPDQGGITEEQIKQLLVGKSLYLRGRYLDDSLSFNEHGGLIGHSPQGSYTLSAIQIDKVHLTKHKVELEGARYGLHFNEQLAYEDSSTAYDKVRITPKKKLLRITIDREVVVKPKKEKEKGKGAKPAPAKGAPPSTAPASAAPDASAAPADAEPSPEDQAKAEIAAAPAEERPADPGSVTTTTSPAHATEVLRDALDKIFAPGLDERMMTSMPAFWQLYYQAVADKTDYRPKDPSILRQNTVDTKARLLTTFEPGSNEYAQANGVAGMALYHAVIGADGKPGEIAVARPIGFGLDENAVAAIQNAKFAPAIKDGKPVSVLLDLVVQFRIYSKRTAVTGAPEEADKPAAPVLPGPYSIDHTPQPAQPAPAQQPAPPTQAQQPAQASQ
jgi:TonB family protein